jgi:hypothetical protein
MTKPPMMGGFFVGEAELSAGMLLGKDEHLPDNGPEQGMLVVMLWNGSALVDDDLVAAGPAAIDSGILDDLAGLPFLIKRPGLRLDEVSGVSILCHATRTCFPAPGLWGDLDAGDASRNI